MKKIVKRLFLLVLVLALVASACWYMFVYDRATVQTLLVDIARGSAQRGDFKTAGFFYDLSASFSGPDQNVAIELSNIYASSGNYTKAEYTLTNAIAQQASAELYIALCRTYVAQDKLLDAVTLLDNILDPGIKAQVDALRPAAPVVDMAPGFYNQYITLNFTQAEGDLYLTTDGAYPSLSDGARTEPVTLAQGQTKLYALTLEDNGLVSPLSILNYTVGGVIEEVTLTDPALDALIRQELMFGEDTVIYTSDLWTIRSLTVPSETQDLSDLALLTHLEELTITDREIPSFSFLSSMPQLRRLTITGCSLGEGLNLVGTLPALNHLTLSDCGLSSLADLSSALLLTSLDLSHNAIGDLTVLGSMAALEELNLSENAVSDLSPLAHLGLLKKLDLRHNAVASMVPLTSCAAMEELDVSYNAISDIRAVSKMPALRRFSAAHNGITSLAPLSGCAALEELDVSENSLTDLSGLDTLSALRELNFSNNQVTMLPALSCNLVTFYADHNALTDVTVLGTMSNLNYVYLDYNPELADISFLTGCSQLVQVNVYATAVPADSVNALLDQSVIVNFDPT